MKRVMAICTKVIGETMEEQRRGGELGKRQPTINRQIWECKMQKRTRSFETVASL